MRMDTSERCRMRQAVIQGGADLAILELDRLERELAEIKTVVEKQAKELRRIKAVIEAKP